MNDSTFHIDSTQEYGNERRRFLKRSMAAALASMGGGAFAGLIGRDIHAAALTASPDYGPLAPAVDATTGLALISLPAGFSYKTYGWTGDIMADGKPTPGLHDGMGVVGIGSRRIVLVRNHELGSDTGAFGPVEIQYDPAASGGTTKLIFDLPSGQWIKSYPGLGGTVRNCAGGRTPWASWITCEETTANAGAGTRFTKDHGWCFEVPALGKAMPTPLRAMGRFNHEAAAVDPVTGYVYETEDRNQSGFYRFLPATRGKLAAGGRLQMLKVKGVTNQDLGIGMANGTRFNVEWVDIADPERVHSPGTTDAGGVFAQGFELGGAIVKRGEGCWYGQGFVFFTSTSGGAAGAGQIWQYNPRAETIKLIFESPSTAVLSNPDNIAVSPRGGIILCEDGGRPKDLLQGLTREGQIFPFAENNVILNGEVNGIAGNFTGHEWTGATFYDRWLFVNIQSPGITFAITGPWENGAL